MEFWICRREDRRKSPPSEEGIVIRLAKHIVGIVYVLHSNYVANVNLIGANLDNRASMLLAL